MIPGIVVSMNFQPSFRHLSSLCFVLGIVDSKVQLWKSSRLREHQTSYTQISMELGFVLALKLASFGDSKSKNKNKYDFFEIKYSFSTYTKIHNFFRKWHYILHKIGIIISFLPIYFSIKCWNCHICPKKFNFIQFVMKKNMYWTSHAKIETKENKILNWNIL